MSTVCPTGMYSLETINNKMLDLGYFEYGNYITATTIASIEDFLSKVVSNPDNLLEGVNRIIFYNNNTDGFVWEFINGCSDGNIHLGHNLSLLFMRMFGMSL